MSRACSLLGTKRETKRRAILLAMCLEFPLRLRSLLTAFWPAPAFRPAFLPVQDLFNQLSVQRNLFQTVRESVKEQHASLCWTARTVTWRGCAFWAFPSREGSLGKPWSSLDLDPEQLRS